MNTRATNRVFYLLQLLFLALLLSRSSSSSSAFSLKSLQKAVQPNNNNNKAAAAPTTKTSNRQERQKTTLYEEFAEPPIIQLRLARVSDVAALQRCNRACLPENYMDKYFLDHLRYSPHLIMVAEHVFPKRIKTNSKGGFKFGNGSGKKPEIVGYILGRVEEKPYVQRRPPPYFNKKQQLALDKFHRGIGVCPTEKFGHVASLAVMKKYQRRGLAHTLLKQFHHNLEKCYDDVAFSGLHVRVSNVAATKLYEKLGYEVDSRLEHYYTDREDAYFMKKIMPLAARKGERYDDQVSTASDNDDFRLPRRIPQPEDDVILVHHQQVQRGDEEEEHGQNRASQEELVLDYSNNGATPSVSDDPPPFHTDIVSNAPLVLDL